MFLYTRKQQGCFSSRSRRVRLEDLLRTTLTVAFTIAWSHRKYLFRDTRSPSSRLSPASLFVTPDTNTVTMVSSCACAARSAACDDQRSLSYDVSLSGRSGRGAVCNGPVLGS